MSRKKLLSDKKIGDRIRELRKDLNLTGGIFGKRIGISQGYLSDIENGKSTANKTLLLAISYIYNSPLNWLLTGEGDMYKTPEGKPQEEPRPGPPAVKEPQLEYADRDEPAPAIVADYPLAKKLTAEIEDAARLGLTEEELIDILAKILEVEQIKRRRRPRPATEPAVEPAPRPATDPTTDQEPLSLPYPTLLALIRRIVKEEIPPEGEPERRKCMMDIVKVLRESDDIKGDISPETP